MRKVLMLIVLLSLLSCKNGKNHSSHVVFFNPTDCTSSQMSESERNATIADKKAEQIVDVVALMNSNGVKLSVLPPCPNGDISEDISDFIALKMLQLVSANGMGGLNTVPGFALGANITQKERRATNTAPSKMLTTYTLDYQVVNNVNGDVYATFSEEIIGVGSSFEEATLNAVQSISNSPVISAGLAEGSKRIINWFETNIATFKMQVEAACSEEDYILALALVESVPQAAPTAFEYAQGCHQELSDKYMNQIALDELVLMKEAITESLTYYPLDLAVGVYAHFKMLPQNTAIYKEAEKLLAEYEAKVFANQTEKKQQDLEAANAKAQIELEKARAEMESRKAIDQAEVERIKSQAQFGDIEAQRAHQLELAKIEVEKIKAKYQATASEKSLQKQLDVQRGFWGNIGARIIDLIEK